MPSRPWPESKLPFSKTGCGKPHRSMSRTIRVASTAHVVETATPRPHRGSGAGRTLDGMDDELAISVRGLRKAYGDNVAVAGVDLDVHRGEVFALLGPNGAGKTTTVEILEGYRQPRRAARSRVLGADPAHADAGLAGPGRHRAAGHRRVRRADRRRGGPPLRRLLPGRRRPGQGDRAGRAGRQGRGPHAHPLRRAEAPPRRGAGHHRPPRAALPRRADHRLRPGGPPRVLGADPRPAPRPAPPSC